MPLFTQKKSDQSDIDAQGGIFIIKKHCGDTMNESQLLSKIQRSYQKKLANVVY